MHAPNETPDILTITRREAIRRTALILGVTLSPSLLTGVMQAQTTAAGPTPAKPTYLKAEQAAIAGAVAERIIPRTDTPGALDVGVPAFIDLMYGKYLSEEEKEMLTKGLAEVERRSVREHKKSFITLPATEQDRLLRQLAEESQKKEKSFFHLIKETTLLGYFSSEPVGKKVLHYDPVPGRFVGDIPLAEVGNVSWTTMH